MVRCTICRFTVELDDVAVPLAAGRGICLLCYSRETETSVPMPKALRREVMALLEEEPPARRAA